MTQDLSDLLYLMRCSLREEQSARDIIHPDEVFKLAQNHALTGLVSFAMPDNGQFRAEQNRIIRTVMLTQAERVAIQKEFASNGIRYLPLKGSVLYRLYPKIGMREMCDVDILVDPERMKQVSEIMFARGYSAELNENAKNEAFHKQPIYSFEIHRTLFQERTNGGNLRRYFSNLLDRLPGDTEKSLSPEDFYVYMIAHFHTHYAESHGIGLRSLTDIFVCLEKMKPDPEYVRKVLTELGLNDFENKARSLAMKLFGVEAPLSVEESTLLEDLASAGAFGSMDHKVERALKTESKAHYVLRRIFVKRVDCESLYPFFYRHPIFLPFLWVYRITVVAFRKRRSIEKELTSLRNAGK